MINDLTLIAFFGIQLLKYFGMQTQIPLNVTGITWVTGQGGILWHCQVKQYAYVRILVNEHVVLEQVN